MLGQDSECAKSSNSTSYPGSLSCSYGEKGTFIVTALLQRMFPESSTSIQYICPLSVQLFIPYVLLPHVMAEIIAEDFGVTVHEGLDIMLESSDYGYLVHPVPEDDDENWDRLVSQIRIPRE